MNPVVTLTAPADQNNVEGDNVSLQVTASDALNQPLTYSAGGLPAGLSIDASTGLISGTVDAGDSADGPYDVTVSASDGTYSSSVSFNWSVSQSASATPTLTNPGTQVNVSGDSVYLSLAGSNTDPDPLTWSATGLPNGLVLDSTGLISGSPTDVAVSPTPYVVTATAQDANGNSASVTFDWIINDAPIQIQAAAPVSATEGADTGSLTLATFTDTNTGRDESDYVAMINWGDGTSDEGVVSGDDGSFSVSDDHVYEHPGTYPVQASLTDPAGQTVTASTTAVVAVAPITANGGFMDYAVQGQAVTPVLATFLDANPNEPANSYTGQINWGDGSKSTGVVTGSNGEWSVSGTHTYAEDGVYTVQVTLTDEDGTQATATSWEQVGNVYAGLPAGLTVATFTSSNPQAQTSDFTARITWGDGTAPATGTVVEAGGVFSVEGSHTYASDGTYTVQVAVADAQGDTLSASSSVIAVGLPVSVYAANTPESASGVVSKALVGVFTDADPADTAGEYAATISWGDGTSSAGTVVMVGPGLFAVYGSHTYAQAGSDPIGVSVFWGDPQEKGDALAMAAPPAAAPKMDDLVAVLKANFAAWSNGGSITLPTVRRLLADPAVKGNQAAAIAVLYGFVLNPVSPIQPAPYANLFVKDLNGWSPETNGITMADLTYFEDNLKGGPLRANARTLNTWFQTYTTRIANTSTQLFTLNPKELKPNGPAADQWLQSISQGGVGDCVFLSVVATMLATDPQRFLAMFPPDYKTDREGYYNLTFGDTKNGTDVTVPVSSPTPAQIALYSSSGQSGIWLSVLEKGYALLLTQKKVASGFGTIDINTYMQVGKSQSPPDTMTLVTGHLTDSYRLNGDGKADVTQGGMEKALKRAKDKGLLVVVEVPPESTIGKAIGLPQNQPVAHTFGIVKISKSIATVVLQNPWNLPKPAASTAPVNYWGNFPLSTKDLFDNGRLLVIEHAK